jgi:hypothetical protein
MISTMDSLGSARHRKLVSLAIADCLPLCFPAIQPLVSEAVSVVVGVALALESTDPCHIQEAIPGRDGSCLSASFRALAASDPVVHVSLRAHLLARISQARSLHGQPFDSSLDQSVLSPILPS